MLYFEFEEKRRRADVTWPRTQGDIVVHINDKEIGKNLPTDLYFEIAEANKVSFIEEDPANKRLLELQNVLARRLQELANR